MENKVEIVNADTGGVVIVSRMPQGVVPAPQPSPLVPWSHIEEEEEDNINADNNDNNDNIQEAIAAIETANAAFEQALGAINDTLSEAQTIPVEMAIPSHQNNLVSPESSSAYSGLDSDDEEDEYGEDDEGDENSAPFASLPNQLREQGLSMTDNGALAYSASSASFPKVFILLAQFKSRITFDAKAERIVKEAMEENPGAAIKVIFHFGNSRGTKKGSSTLLRSNMNCLFPTHLQVPHDYDGDDIKGGCCAQDVWMHCLGYLWEHYPSILADRTNLALVARNGCLVDLLDLCIVAIYGRDVNTNPKNLAYAGSYGQRASRPRKYASSSVMGMAALYTKHDRRSERLEQLKRNVRKFMDEKKIEGKEIGTVLEHRTMRNAAGMEFGVVRPMRDGIYTHGYRMWCNEQHVQKPMKEAKEKRDWLGLERMAKIKKAQRDAKCLTLFKNVADIFATLIEQDFSLLQQGKIDQISGLGAKWAPSCGGRHAKLTGMDEVIYDALCMKFPHVIEIERSYPKILKAIRRAAKVPESFMGVKGELDKVDFNRMASRALKKHDKFLSKSAGSKDNYQAWKDEKTRAMQEALRELNDLLISGTATEEELEKARKKVSKASVASSAVHPHELVEKVLEPLPGWEFGDDSERLAQDALVDLQWNSQAQEVCRACEGSGRTSVFMCDTSDSMSGLPLLVAIALSLMGCTSVPRDSPWYGRLITFDSIPKLVDLRDTLATMEPATPGYLRTMATAISQLAWGGTTDFELAFDALLKHAKDAGVTIDELNRMRIIVLSDMQFDDSRPSGRAPLVWGQPRPSLSSWWETTYERIIANADEIGYKNFIPGIVFWNLKRDISDAMPAPYDAAGVIQVTGYSVANMMAVMGKENDLEGMVRRQIQEQGNGGGGGSDDDDEAVKQAKGKEAEEFFRRNIAENRAYEGIMVVVD